MAEIFEKSIGGGDESSRKRCCENHCLDGASD